MPLKAILNGKEIYAYSYDEKAWISLKNTYRKNCLRMACCERAAIPKNSKLGTQYFAHHKRGDCTTAPESKEHLYLKDLVARVAEKYGWHVETESVGATPNGEDWIADVLCIKRSRMAVEIQWSYQSEEEYERRQEKYRVSGLRSVWLYRLRGNTRRFNLSMLDEHSYELPAFGLVQDKETGQIKLPQFDIGVEKFVDGMFDRRLTFKPKPGEVLTAEVMGAEKDECWHCNEPMNFVTGFDIIDSSGERIRHASLNEPGVAELIKRRVPDRMLARMGYGRVRSRYIRDYNCSPDCGITCRKCHRNNGGFWASQKSCDFLGKPRPKPVFTFNFVNGKEVESLRGDWYFNRLSSATDL